MDSRIVLNPKELPSALAISDSTTSASPAQPAFGCEAWSCEVVDSLPGYEELAIQSDNGVFSPPPPYTALPPVAPLMENFNWTMPSISEDVAKQAFIEYATKKCCYGTAPAKTMVFKDLKPFNTYRYCLETFTESRACRWVSVPYCGQVVDSPENGPAPSAWDVKVVPPVLFKKNKVKIPIPHTSIVKTCGQCFGSGRNRCLRCSGSGRQSCSGCGGSGRNFQNQNCYFCFGSGRSTCCLCHGLGSVTCFTCAGHGRVMNFIQLTVKWRNHDFQFVADHNSKFPTKRFKKVTGQKVFSDEQVLVAPLVNFPVSAIIQASQTALQQHKDEFSSSGRILRQRHTVEWLPLTLVEYIWKEKEFSYFVYGQENKVYTDNYPRKCCCVLQ